MKTSRSPVALTIRGPKMMGTQPASRWQWWVVEHRETNMFICVRELFYCCVLDPYWACSGLRALLYLGLCAPVVLGFRWRLPWCAAPWSLLCAGPRGGLLPLYMYTLSQQYKHQILRQSISTNMVIKAFFPFR
jgi:hypothetical protein